MSEPNKERFFATLKDKNFSLNNLKDNIDTINELLWYLDSDRVKSQEIVRDLVNMNNKDRVITITNLAKLYPLSQNLVLAILDNVDINYSDEAFIYGLDVANNVKNAIKGILENVHKVHGKLTNNTSIYKKEISSLKDKQIDLENELKENSALKAELEQLRAKVDQLTKETDETLQRKELEDLKDEEQRLLAKKRNQEDEKNKIQRHIVEICLELKAAEAQPGPKEKKKILQEFLLKFPKDAEEN